MKVLNICGDFQGFWGTCGNFNFNVRWIVCYNMSELSDTTVSDVGSDEDSGSGHDNDDAIQNEPPVEIVDGLTTYFINDPCGNLKTFNVFVCVGVCVCVCLFVLRIIRVSAGLTWQFGNNGNEYVGYYCTYT